MKSSTCQNKSIQTPLARSREKPDRRLCTVATISIVLALVGMVTVTMNQNEAITPRIPHHHQQQHARKPLAANPQYYKTKHRGTYDEIKRQCAATSGQMASIHDDNDNTKATNLCPSDETCWIGLSDKLNDGDYLWEDGSVLSFQKWYGGSPNDVSGREDCAVVNYDPPSMQWEVYRCTNEYFGICQKIGKVTSYQCPPGTHETSRDEQGGCVCESCPAGHYCLGGDHPKLECPLGHFQPLEGQAACDPAPQGHKVSVTKALHPEPCLPGNYQDDVGQASCKPSPKGNAVPNPAAAYPTPCAPGKYQNEIGQTSCKPCPVGNKCAGTGNEEPRKCHYGQYQDETGKEVCKNAEAGKHAPEMGMDKPVDCDANTFQPCEGQKNCIPCEDGMVSAKGAHECLLPEL